MVDYLDRRKTDQDIGCMQMRQLGKGHSVMFFALGEVDRHIHNRIPRPVVSDGCIWAIDVLRWAMHKTCEDICHHLPHWAQQGLNHNKHFAAYNKYKSTKDLKVLKNVWLQCESHTLEEMYLITPGNTSPEMYSVPFIRERIEQLGVTKLVDVRMTEEQEHEADHEVEQEHQVDQWDEGGEEELQG
jgi:hypothetical protein